MADETEFNWATNRPLIDEQFSKPLKPSEMKALINQIRNKFRNCHQNDMQGDMWFETAQILNRWGIYEDLP